MQIDSTGRLAAVIRRQVACLAKPGGSAAGARGTSFSPKQGPGSPVAATPPRDIAALLARRVQAIDPDDPQRHRKAFRVFLESVLLAEFGDNLVNDAGFHQLVEDVHSEMDSDAQLAQAIREATTAMLSSSPRPPAGEVDRRA